MILFSPLLKWPPSKTDSVASIPQQTVKPTSLSSSSVLEHPAVKQALWTFPTGAGVGALLGNWLDSIINQSNRFPQLIKQAKDYITSNQDIIGKPEIFTSRIKKGLMKLNSTIPVDDFVKAKKIEQIKIGLLNYDLSPIRLDATKITHSEFHPLNHLTPLQVNEAKHIFGPDFIYKNDFLKQFTYLHSHPDAHVFSPDGFHLEKSAFILGGLALGSLWTGLVGAAMATRLEQKGKNLLTQLEQAIAEKPPSADSENSNENQPKAEAS